MVATDGRTRVSADWSYRGLRALVLENRRLRVVILPELGGKVWSIVDKASDLELLWTNPRVPPRRVPFGAGYDDSFFGGWDELYPNDEPEVLAGESMPDHGEVWSLPWEWSTGTDSDSAWVELSVQTPISTTRATKVLTLAADSAELVVGYRLENTGSVTQPYLWKSHVAVRLHEGSRFDMGAETVLLHEFGSPRARPDVPTFRWPELRAAGRSYDLRELPAAGSGHSEFLLATSMTDGFCSVTHPGQGVALRLDFDLVALPSCWTFASYGGWRGLHVLVLEPCTGYPLSVAEGVAAGTHQELAPGEVREWALTATVSAAPAPAPAAAAAPAHG